MQSAPFLGSTNYRYSVQARSKSQAGDYAGASHAARNARIWLIVSVVLGVVVITLSITLGLVGAILGAAGQYQYSID